MRKRKRKHLADGENQEDDQASKFADWGCLTLIVGLIVGAFLFMSDAIALNIMQTFAPTWPLWISLIIGAALSLGIMKVLWAIGSDLYDVIVRILIVSTMIVILSPIFIRAKENARKRQKQEAMKAMKNNPAQTPQPSRPQLPIQ